MRYLHYASLALFLVVFASNAKAHPIAGRGVVCDTPAQVEEYITLKGGDAALEVINAKEKNACALLLVAFEKGGIVKTIGGKEITEILVVAWNDGVWHQLVPMMQYTIFVIKGEDA